MKCFCLFFKTLRVYSPALRPHLDVCLLNSSAPLDQFMFQWDLFGEIKIAGFIHSSPLLHRFSAVWLQNEILQHGEKSTPGHTNHKTFRGESSAKFKIGKSCRKPRYYFVHISKVLYIYIYCALGFLFNL